MKHFYRLVAAFLSVAVLAACGGGNNGLSSSTPVVPEIGVHQLVPGPASQPMAGQQPLAAGKEKAIYSFQGDTDGANPIPAPLEVKGVLYGTTVFGGGSGCGGSGCGTIFTTSTSGKGYRVLYHFKGSTDGANPEAPLINVSGTLYGTTANGGGSGCYNGGGCGTVFKVDPSGKGYQVLYHFKGGADGAYPLTGVIEGSGVLYGVAYGGGAGAGCGSTSGCGTVFTVSTRGKEHVLYTFQGGTDGANPLVLVYESGTLYGVTTVGGSSGCGGGGCGTVYDVNSASGAENVLYSFTGGSDGADPQSSLIDLNGTLYGTTYVGGGSGCSGNGCGTVFDVNSSTGAESVLYRFKGGKDGAKPSAGLIDVSGELYGPTTAGGGSGCGGGGCGTIYAVNSSSGTESVSYRFKGKTDGASPESTLTDLSGTFYGATYDGGGTGCGGNGCGTIFEVTP